MSTISSNRMTDQTNLQRIIFKFLEPLVILRIIILSSWLLSIKIPWQSSMIIFHGFFALLVGSFIVEVILSSKKNGLRDTLELLYLKNMPLIPLEFVEVVSQAGLSFATDIDAARLLELSVVAITMVCYIGMEALYHYVVPRLKGKELKGASEMVVIVFLVPGLVFFWIYTFLASNNYNQIH